MKRQVHESCMFLNKNIMFTENTSTLPLSMLPELRGNVSYGEIKTNKSVTAGSGKMICISITRWNRKG